MPAYYDSSFLLANLFQQPGCEEFDRLWNSETIRVSSCLIEGECIVSIRRAAVQGRLEPDEAEVIQKISELDNYLTAIIIRDIDAQILSILRYESKLSNCRTLDALHLSTALYFQQQLEEELVICTFDKRLSDSARLLGFKVLPE